MGILVSVLRLKAMSGHFCRKTGRNAGSMLGSPCPVPSKLWSLSTKKPQWQNPIP